MEKLVERFEKINGRLLSQHGNAMSSAEEARKIAIEFAKHIDKEYISIWNTDKFVWKHYNFIRTPEIEFTYEQLFDKFINEYYEKTKS